MRKRNTPVISKISYKKLPCSAAPCRKMKEDRIYHAAFSYAEKPSMGALYTYMRAVIGSGGGFWQLRR